MDGKHSKHLRELAQGAIFTALLCFFSPLAVYIGAIPVTLGNFAVLLTALVLGIRRAPAAVGTFLLLGLCGLPIFAGGNSGLTALPGLTGGYIWSYLPMTVVIGLLTRRLPESRVSAVLQSTLACLAGLCICYACGSLQYALLTGLPPGSVWKVCVLPFVGFDLCKALIASLLGVTLRRRLVQLR